MKKQFPTFVDIPWVFTLAFFLSSQRAALPQIIEIPDAGLQAAVRLALGKPSGDLTVADMQSITALDASQDARGQDAPIIHSLEGLQNATNLKWLNLQGLTNLISWPGNIDNGDLSPIGGLTNLTVLNLDWNGSISSVILPPGLSSLTTLQLDLMEALSDVSLPSDLTNLTYLGLCRDGLLSALTLPAGLTSLRSLSLYADQLTSLTCRAGLPNLSELDLHFNQLTDVSFLCGLTSLTNLNLSNNPLIGPDFTLPDGLTNLTMLFLRDNQLASLILPNGLTPLRELYLSGNQLTDAPFLPGLTNLTILDLSNNQLTNFALPASLTALAKVYLEANQLTNLTIPLGLTVLSYLGVANNPLTTLVLPESAVGALFPQVGFLVKHGVGVYTYSDRVRLAVQQPILAGVCNIGLAGPPGTYRVQVTSDFSNWIELGMISNTIGTATYADPSAGQRSRGFYRAHREH